MLIGPQASGKGTFSKMIEQTREIKAISSGSAFRRAIESGALSAELAESHKRGNLMPDEAVYAIMEQILPTDSDILLDGFPRTIDQAKWLEQWAGDDFDITVVFLDMPDEITWTRIQKRIADGGSRADDADIESIRTRLALYHEKTMPLVEWYRANPKVKFSQVDVSRTVEENFKDVARAIE